MLKQWACHKIKKFIHSCR